MSSSILFPTNQYTTSSKSPEQIQQMILPDYYKIQDVLSHIVNKGLPPQLQYLYANMHKAFRITLVFVCSKAIIEQPQNQLLIAVSFRQLLTKQAANLTTKQLNLMFQTCLQCLNNLQSIANQQFAIVIQLILKNSIDCMQLLRRLQTRALQLGKTSQPIISKVGAARMICMLSRFGNRTLKGQMVDILKRVFADVEIQARKIWLTQFFPKLLINLDLQCIQLHFQEKLFEAIWDQNTEIGILAQQVILKNAQKFSGEQQASRIVKLFIQSLTSKNEKTVSLATKIMGQTYQKLLNIILSSQQHCIKFWKSLIQLSQVKNQTHLNNIVYNLPGILQLASSHHRVDPLCDIYVQLFYSPLTNKLVLASYFHQMAQLFPGKAQELRQLLYWMLNQFFEDNQPSQQAVKVVNKIVSNLNKSRNVFLVELSKQNLNEQAGVKLMDITLCNYLIKYLNFLLIRKISKWQEIFLQTLTDCYDCFSRQFIQNTLLPKLYSLLRMKLSNLPLLVELVIKLVTRDSNPALINSYISKVTIQLGKSSRSFERQSAVLFFYYASFYLCVETFQEYRLGQKYLHFYNDEYFKVRAFFVSNLPRIFYFLNREQKIQYNITLRKIGNDIDSQIQKIVQHSNFSEDEQKRDQIMTLSNQLRQKEKEKVQQAARRRQQNHLRRTTGDHRREDLLKKKNQLIRVKNKTLLRDLNKKRQPTSLIKTNSQFNMTRKQARHA